MQLHALTVRQRIGRKLQFPNTTLSHLQRMRAAIPFVEITHQKNRLRRRCPLAHPPRTINQIGIYPETPMSIGMGKHRAVFLFDRRQLALKPRYATPDRRFVRF